MVTFAEGSGSPVDNQFAPQGDVGVPSAIVFFKMAPPPELAGRFKSVGRNLHVHVAAEGGR